MECCQIPVPQPKKFLLELTESDFDNVIAVGHHFVKFYAPWCGHCQRLAPIWEELAKTFEHQDWLSVGKVIITCNFYRFLCLFSIANETKNRLEAKFFNDNHNIFCCIWSLVQASTLMHAVTVIIKGNADIILLAFRSSHPPPLYSWCQ